MATRKNSALYLLRGKKIFTRKIFFWKKDINRLKIDILKRFKTILKH